MCLCVTAAAAAILFVNVRNICNTKDWPACKIKVQLLKHTYIRASRLLTAFSKALVSTRQQVVCY